MQQTTENENMVKNYENLMSEPLLYEVHTMKAQKRYV